MTAEHNLKERLSTKGWVFLPAFAPSLSTFEVATSLGSLVDCSRHEGYDRFSGVQRVRPHHCDHAPRTVYSGNFGLGEFPLHTDLAHWYRPPRFFLLRCIVGAQGVATTLLDGKDIVTRLQASLLRRALFQPRRAHLGKRPLLRALERFVDGDAIRCDSLFLRPVNAAAQTLAHQYAALVPCLKLELERAGDSLLVDNWRILHGRTAVHAGGTHRLLERAYLDNICE
jgi:L-asparagine oxygenase